MTEVEWESSTDPDAMLRFVRGRVSDRKLRLFAAASFRRLLALLPDPRQRRGIEALEQWAEGTLEAADRRLSPFHVRAAIPEDNWKPGAPIADDPHFIALMLYREFCSRSIAVHAVTATAGLADGAGEQNAQAQLMRCILGNPFRPSRMESGWVTPVVDSLSRAIYAERAFDRLPILSDALEEAGCDNFELLAHARDEGPHARGCWVIDLILERS